ncbi:MAG: 50S ribosomal protein L9 [Pseudomonadales bacterium]|nr:50S ribosomal protein L9 [Pseudomonadales bacterium]
MNVILLERLRNLGDLGEEVNVRPGYARNYLIPKGKAVRASDEARSHFETRRAELESAANELLGAAQARADRLKDLAITIVVKAGEEGKLYGSVGTQDIAEAVTRESIEVEKSEVRLPDGVIRTIGEYEIDVQLHSDVTATIKLSVVAE